MAESQWEKIEYFVQQSLSENENCVFCFYFRNRGNFFANPIFNYFVCITYIQRNCIHTQTNTCYSMIYYNVYHHMGFPNDSVGKESACNPGDTGDVGSIHGSRRSPGVGNVNPRQYSCLKNPMDRVTLQATVQRVTESQKRLKQLCTHKHCHHMGQNYNASLTQEPFS